MFSRVRFYFSGLRVCVPENAERKTFEKGIVVPSNFARKKRSQFVYVVLKNMTRSKSVFAFILVLFSCRGSLLYWKTFTHGIETSQKNYIRFNLPRNIVDGREGIIVDKYSVKIFWEETDTPFHRFLLINPSRGLGIWDQLYGADQFVFYPECEYKIEIPAGENGYRIEISKLRSYNGFYAEKEIRIHPPSDHSIRVSLYFESVSHSPFRPSDRTEELRLNSRIRIAAEVEPNPNPESATACEISE